MQYHSSNHQHRQNIENIAADNIAKGNISIAAEAGLQVNKHSLERSREIPRTSVEGVVNNKRTGASFEPGHSRDRGSMLRLGSIMMGDALLYRRGSRRRSCPLGASVKTYRSPSGPWRTSLTRWPMSIFSTSRTVPCPSTSIRRIS